MSSTTSISLPPFRNEPFTDFSNAANQRAMREALDRIRVEMGRTYDLIIGGRDVQTPSTFHSINPANPSEIVGIHYAAGAREAGQAVEAAELAFTTWGKTSAADRAALLLRAASLLRRRRLEFCAWLVFEVGKNWG